MFFDIVGVHGRTAPKTSFICFSSLWVTLSLSLSLSLKREPSFACFCVEGCLYSFIPLSLTHRDTEVVNGFYRESVWVWTVVLLV